MARSIYISTDRNMLNSGECRKIRDCCIFRVNDLEVFL